MGKPQAQLPPPFLNVAIIFHQEGGSDAEEILSVRTTVSIGWVVAATENEVILAAERSDDEGAAMFSTIPRRAIVDMYHLKEPPEDPPSEFNGLGIVPDPDDPVWQPS